MAPRKSEPMLEYVYQVPRFSVRLVKDSDCPTPDELVKATEVIAAKILQALTEGLPHEEVYLLLLDSKSRITGSVKVGQGGQMGCSLMPHDIYRPLIAHDAKGFIIGHNHPSGNHAPSHADIELTKQLVKAGEILQIRCLDHIVVSEEGYTSMYAENLGRCWS